MSVEVALRREISSENLESGLLGRFIPLRWIDNGKEILIMASIKPGSHSSLEERRERRAEMAQALARGGMEGVHVISLEQAEEVLTPRRMEILDVLSHGEYESVRGLARELGRDKGQVSRDLGLLAEHGIVTFDTDGRSKSPRLGQEHVVIEPIV
jgi:predicted transcriptional regulator